MRRWVTIGSAVALIVVSGLAWAQNDLLREPVEFSDVEPSNTNIAYGDIDYVVRRGWFSGKEDGTFDPMGRVTSAQMARVIDRAFPDGITRNKLAALLTGGEWAAELTPGRTPNNPIPMGQVWKVGDWDIRVLETWPQEGYDELNRRSPESPTGRWPRPPQGNQYTLVDVEVVYRGTQSTGSFFDILRYFVATDEKFWASDCLHLFNKRHDNGRIETYFDLGEGYLHLVASDIQPGVPVRGWLCRVTDEGENPNVMQIVDASPEGRWAWFSI